MPVDPQEEAIIDGPSGPVDKTTPGGPLSVGGFGSDHSGITNFLFGDGAVRSVSDAITPAVMQQLADRADGKLLTSGPTRNDY